MDDEKGEILVDGKVFALTVNVLASGLAVSEEAQITDTKSLRATDRVNWAFDLILNDDGRNQGSVGLRALLNYGIEAGNYSESNNQEIEPSMIGKSLWHSDRRINIF